MGRVMLIRDAEEDADQEKEEVGIKSASETSNDGEDDDPPKSTTSISSTSTSFPPPSTSLSSKSTSFSSILATLSTASTRSSTTALAAPPSISTSTFEPSVFSATSSRPSVVVAATSTSSTLKPTGAAIADAENGTLPSVTQHNVVSNTLIVFGSLGIVAIMVLLIAILVVLKKKKTNGGNNFVDNENQPGNMSTSPNDFQQDRRPSLKLDPFADPPSGNPNNSNRPEYPGPFADPPTLEGSHWSSTTRTRSVRVETSQVGNLQVGSLPAGSPQGGGHAADPVEDAERRHLEDQRERTWAALAGQTRNGDQSRP